MIFFFVSSTHHNPHFANLGLEIEFTDVGDANSEGETHGADTFTFESKAPETLLAARSEELKILQAMTKDLGRALFRAKGTNAWRILKENHLTLLIKEVTTSALKSSRLSTRTTSKLSETGFDAVFGDEELVIHDATNTKTHLLTASISELAKNLEWQDATRVSVIDFFSPLWTRVFVCFLKICFCNELVHG